MIVETGAGLSDAETYVSTSQATTIAKGLGLKWSDDVDVVEQALHIAAFKIDMVEWPGTVKVAGQALKWPRQEHGIPRRLIHAQVAVASAHIAGHNVLGTVGDGGVVTAKSAGDSSWSYSGTRTDGQINIPIYDAFVTQYNTHTPVASSVFSVQRG